MSVRDFVRKKKALRTSDLLERLPSLLEDLHPVVDTRGTPPPIHQEEFLPRRESQRLCLPSSAS
jgi:hypothetical protein